MFHPFPKLPTELRVYVWELAIGPRLVSITTVAKYGQGHIDILCVKARTPCPAVMQVCRESRGNAKYQRAFTSGLEPRYTWINFEWDMIACSWTDYVLCGFDEDSRNIRRMQLTTDDEWPWNWYIDNDSWDADQALRKNLPSLREAHILDLGAQPNVDIHGPPTWSSIFVPVSSIRHVDSMTGAVVIDSRQYRCGGEPAKNHFSYGQNDRIGGEKSGEELRKMIHDATPLLERHLVRLKIGGDHEEILQ